MVADVRVASLKIYVLIQCGSTAFLSSRLPHQIGTGGQGGGRKMTYNKAENENLICGPDQGEIKALKQGESQGGDPDVMRFEPVLILAS